jgi:hypothetical protein
VSGLALFALLNARESPARTVVNQIPVCKPVGVGNLPCCQEIITLANECILARTMRLEAAGEYKKPHKSTIVIHDYKIGGLYRLLYGCFYVIPVGV